MVQSGTARHASAHSACPRRPVGTTKHATHRTNVMNAHRIPLFRVVGAVPGATTAEDDERTCVRSARNHAPRRTHPARVVSIVTPMVTQVTLKQQTVRECAADGHTDAWNRPQQSRRTNSNAVKSYLLGKMYGFTVIIMAAGSCTLVLSTPGAAQLCSYCAAALVRCAQTTTVAVKMRHHNHRNRQVLPAATPTMVPLPRISPSALSRDLPFFCSGLLSPEVSRVARVWNQPPHL